MLFKVVAFIFRKFKPNSGSEAYQYTPLSRFSLQRLQIESQRFSYRPLISILVPTYNTPLPLLEKCIDSVRGQVYENWELCIADDNSTSEALKEYLTTLKNEPRITVQFRTHNGHIAACSNTALEMARGEYTALLDHDDELAPEALVELVKVLQTRPTLDFLYTDEDKIDEQGNHFDPVRKPDWSPDTFYSWNYICHLAMFRTTILKRIGGFSAAYNGSQDYELILRFTEQTHQVAHIPKIVYHWRMHSESVAMNTHAKPYAYLNGKKALEDSLKRAGKNAEVEMHLGEMLGMYSVHYALHKQSKISIIIPTRNCAFLVKICIDSIFQQSSYTSYEIILIDNNSDDPAFFQLLEEYAAKYPGIFRVVRAEIPFNFSALMNIGAKAATGDYLLLLNNDTKVISPDWLERMLAHGQQPHTGAVGARLLYKNNTIQHNGIVLHSNGIAEHVYAYEKDQHAPPQAECIRNYPAVTAACLLVEKQKYWEVGGFDENLAVDYNDIDFCLKLGEKGYHNVCLPHVKLHHFESISRGKEKKSMDKYAQYLSERKNFTEKWLTAR
ncbi:MAG: glycosyltransferase family 2 protein [Cytophagaceae bacterium]|nr:glycosyltransferase family 2 protein [Cytophagaceae bacterium]